MGRKTTTGVVGTATPQINITSNTITTTVVNSDLTLTPNGTGKVTTANAVTFTNNTASTSVSTGALVVTGGVGIGGAVFTTGAIKTDSTTASTDTTTGSLIAAGGLGVAGAVNAGGAIKTTSTTAATSTSTGSLIAGGGAGIAGALWVGGGANVTGGLTVAGGTSGIIGYNLITAATNVTDVDGFYLIISTSSYIVTLPATTTNGRTLIFSDGGNFTSFPITLARNTKTINGVAEDLILDQSKSRIEMVYYNGDWKVFIS